VARLFDLRYAQIPSGETRLHFHFLKKMKIMMLPPSSLFSVLQNVCLKNNCEAGRIAVIQHDQYYGQRNNGEKRKLGLAVQ
jgi:hypothetical protein